MRRCRLARRAERLTIHVRHGSVNVGGAMEFHRGRLLDHVQLRVKDLEASKRFYRAVLSALGQGDNFVEGDGNFYADELFVDVAEDAVTHTHLAFQAGDKGAV